MRPLSTQTRPTEGGDSTLLDSMEEAKTKAVAESPKPCMHRCTPYFIVFAFATLVGGAVFYFFAHMQNPLLSTNTSTNNYVCAGASHGELAGTGARDVYTTTYEGSTETEKDNSCCASCSQHSDCEYWVRATDSQSCWLKSNDGHPIREVEDVANRRGGVKRPVVNIWSCHDWTTDDWQQKDAGVPEKEVCEQHPAAEYTGGDNKEHQGCGSCWCCEYLGTYDLEFVGSGGCSCGDEAYCRDGAEQEREVTLEECEAKAVTTGAGWIQWGVEYDMDTCWTQTNNITGSNGYSGFSCYKVNKVAPPPCDDCRYVNRGPGLCQDREETSYRYFLGCEDSEDNCRAKCSEYSTCFAATLSDAPIEKDRHRKLCPYVYCRLHDRDPFTVTPENYDLVSGAIEFTGVYTATTSNDLATCWERTVKKSHSPKSALQWWKDNCEWLIATAGVLAVGMSFCVKFCLCEGDLRQKCLAAL